MQHLYPRPLCQHSTWHKHQTVNQQEPKLFIQTEYLTRILDVSWLLNTPPVASLLKFFISDALQLSIPAQGLANGDAALPHAAYPGIQPYPGVGKFKFIFHSSFAVFRILCSAS